MILAGEGLDDHGFFVIAKVRAHYVYLDPEDYEWAKKWRWNVVYNSQGRLAYVSRSTRLHGAKGKQTRLYLHKEILLRAKGKAGKCTHHIGDHLDGDSLNNRRRNLRWANPAMNARNNKAKRKKEKLPEPTFPQQLSFPL